MWSVCFLLLQHHYQHINQQLNTTFSFNMSPHDKCFITKKLNFRWEKKGLGGRIMIMLNMKKAIHEKKNTFSRKCDRFNKYYLPISRMGRGPYLSIRIPSGRVVALSKKEPMVKPRFSISSWSTQLSHSSSPWEDELLKVTCTVLFSVGTSVQDWWENIQKLLSLIVATLWVQLCGSHLGSGTLWRR